MTASLIGYYFLGLFSPYNYFTAKWDIGQGQAKLLVYGESSLDEEIENRIAPEFGFHRTRIADCVITDLQANRADQYNAVVLDYLEERNGKDWQEKYDRRFGQEYSKKN